MRARLTILLLFCAVIAKAQVTRVDSIYDNRQVKFKKYNNRNLYSYTLGLKLFSYEELPKILNQTNSQEFTRNLTNGLILKYNDNQISYRLSGSFFSKDISFENECRECEQAKGKLNDYALRIGFEKNFIYADIQPYFGGDIGFRRNAFDGTVTSKKTGAYAYDAVSLKNGLSMTPSFGIKFNVIDHFTLAVESSIDLLYSYEKQERSVAENPANVSHFRKWEFLLKPVSRFSLQYNFGADF